MVVLPDGLWPSAAAKPEHLGLSMRARRAEVKVNVVNAGIISQAGHAADRHAADH
jgi:hypothetical protein